MELTEKIFKEVYDGWDVAANKGIEWKDIEKKKLEEYCQFIVENGIKPMLNDLGILFPVNMNTENIHILDSVILAKLIIITYPTDPTDIEYTNFCIERDDIVSKGFVEESKGEKIEPLCSSKGELNISSIEPLYAKIIRIKNSYLNEGSYTDEIKQQGYAYKNFQFINKDYAEKELGLHLLCHELMHTIANKTSVDKLKQNIKNLGDEDVNEYFVRLASYYLKTSESAKLYENFLGGTTTEKMKNSKDKSHDSNGTYGVIIKERKRFDNMTEDRLKEIARFYFMGEEAPENFMIVR